MVTDGEISCRTVELAVVTIFGLLVPVGWLGGWATKPILVQLIPLRLRGFPIAALLWSGAGLGLLTLLLSYVAYDPVGSLGEAALLPWGCLQLAAAPAAAGIYGIAEGWLRWLGLGSGGR